MTITLTVRTDTMSPVLKGLASSLSSGRRRQVLWTMGDEFRTITQEQFGADRDHRVVPWPELSKEYQRKIKYFGPPKLILTGALLQGLSLVATDQSATVTANEGYATTHQFGAGNVPARPYFPVIDGQLSQYAEDRIVKRAERELLRLSGI